jgi:hypothetical protein
MVIPSAGERHPQDELSPVGKVDRERGICFLFFRVPHTSLLRVGLVPVSSRESHHLPRKGYQQDALFAAQKVELRVVKKVAGIFSFCPFGIAVITRAGFARGICFCAGCASRPGAGWQSRS